MSQGPSCLSHWLHPEAETELGDAAVYYATHASLAIAEAFLAEYERVLMMKSLRRPSRRPTHPGAILREDVLPALGITQGRFAELIGVSRLTVSQLLHERRALSPDMAMRLEKLLGTSAESWLHMQEAVDLR
jgi:addiction module HigA family antidote